MASIGGLASGRSEPARTSTVRVPAPVSQREVDAVAHRDAECSRACTRSGSRSAAASTTSTCESARAANARERVGELGVLAAATPAGLARRQPGRHQAPAEDDDARPLPLLEALGDVAAGGPGAVGSGRAGAGGRR